MSDTGHYYTPTGEPAHFVPCKTREGTRPTRIDDARKLGLFPGVTTVLQVLNKPGLNDWKVKQAVYAVVTAPTLIGETLDQKIIRVLDVEEQQDQEARIARDTGTQIHEALDKAISGREWDRSLSAFVEPVLAWVLATGSVVWTEKVLVGDGYAGKADLKLHNEAMELVLLVDFKTCSNLPNKKDSWIEHKLQTAAYARADSQNTGNSKVATCNVYISTKSPGDYAVYTQDNWLETYGYGFKPILEYWMWANKHYPGVKS
jgi:hypothetical protein